MANCRHAHVQVDEWTQPGGTPTVGVCVSFVDNHFTHHTAVVAMCEIGSGHAEDVSRATKEELDRALPKDAIIEDIVSDNAAAAVLGMTMVVKTNRDHIRCNCHGYNNLLANGLETEGAPAAAINTLKVCSGARRFTPPTRVTARAQAVGAACAALRNSPALVRHVEEECGVLTGRPPTRSGTRWHFVVEQLSFVTQNRAQVMAAAKHVSSRDALYAFKDQLQDEALFKRAAQLLELTAPVRVAIKTLEQNAVPTGALALPVAVALLQSWLPNDDDPAYIAALKASAHMCVRRAHARARAATVAAS